MDAYNENAGIGACPTALGACNVTCPPPRFRVAQCPDRDPEYSHIMSRAFSPDSAIMSGQWVPRMIPIGELSGGSWVEFDEHMVPVLVRVPTFGPCTARYLRVTDSGEWFAVAKISVFNSTDDLRGVVMYEVPKMYVDFLTGERDQIVLPLKYAILLIWNNESAPPGGKVKWLDASGNVFVTRADVLPHLADRDPDATRALGYVRQQYPNRDDIYTNPVTSAPKSWESVLREFDPNHDAGGNGAGNGGDMSSAFKGFDLDTNEPLIMPSESTELASGVTRRRPARARIGASVDHSSQPAIPNAVGAPSTWARLLLNLRRGATEAPTPDRFRTKQEFYEAMVNHT